MQEVASVSSLALQEWNDESLRLCAGEAGQVSDPSVIGQ